GGPQSCGFGPAWTKTGAHLISYLTERVPYLFQPIQMFRLHQHRTKTRHYVVRGLIRPGPRREKSDRKLGQSEVQIFACRGSKYLLRDTRRNCNRRGTSSPDHDVEFRWEWGEPPFIRANFFMQP